MWPKRLEAMAVPDDGGSGRQTGAGLRVLFPAASSGSAAQPAQRKLNSIADVVRWLKSVPDATKDAELEKIRSAAEVLQEEEPTRDKLVPLCKPWSQPCKRDQKKLNVAVVTAELRESGSREQPGEAPSRANAE